jgi:hypothetical protein
VRDRLWWELKKPYLPPMNVDKRRFGLLELAEFLQVDISTGDDGYDFAGAGFAR